MGFAACLKKSIFGDGLWHWGNPTLSSLEFRVSQCLSHTHMRIDARSGDAWIHGHFRLIRAGSGNLHSFCLHACLWKGGITQFWQFECGNWWWTGWIGGIWLGYILQITGSKLSFQTIQAKCCCRRAPAPVKCVWLYVSSNSFVITTIAIHSLLIQTKIAQVLGGHQPCAATLLIWWWCAVYWSIGWPCG